MALLTEISCTKCGKTKFELAPYGVPPSFCSSCVDESTLQKKLIYLKGLTALKLKKRIALIEEYIYDDKARYKE